MGSPTDGYYRLDVTPMGKPRMTRRDKWDKRPRVARYWAFKDAVRLECARVGITSLPPGARVWFYVPMAKSWGEEKKDEFDGEPHTQKPDVDNMLKALLDAMFDDDAHVWDIHITKRWAREGSIVIYAPAGG